jgi:hypothetical protein
LPAAYGRRWRVFFVAMAFRIAFMGFEVRVGLAEAVGGLSLLPNE